MILIFVLISNLYYVDQPYSSVPGHGVFDIELRFGPQGEILGFFNIGIWDRFGFGISYGAANLIGAGNPEFYEQPGVQARFVALEQGFAIPQIILGFDNQGYGRFDESTGRYDIMSKGIYCQIGKTFSYPSFEFVPSLGINYCFEGDDRLDMFIGIKAQFGSNTVLMLEYSPNFNDDLDQNKGYFNTSLRFVFYEELFFEFALRDLLDNSLNDQQLNRMIRIGYEQGF
jgi:hypothetical protein